MESLGQIPARLYMLQYPLGFASGRKVSEMQLDEYFQLLANCVISAESTIDDSLAMMIILHTQQLRLPPEIRIENVGEARSLCPLTRRHAAEVVALSARQIGAATSYDPTELYVEYDRRTPFEGIYDAPQDWIERVEDVMARLKVQKLVEEISEDD